jgi:hypothetical protein
MHASKEYKNIFNFYGESAVKFFYLWPLNKNQSTMDIIKKGQFVLPVDCVTFLLAGIFILTIGSCQKSNSPSPQAPNSDYFPSSAGSYWHYTYGAPDMNEYDTVAQNTAVLNGKTYNEIDEKVIQNNKTSFGRDYICKNNGTYYGTPGMYGTSFADKGLFEKRVFMDGLKAGNTWTDSMYIPNGTKPYWKKYINTVATVDTSLFVQGSTYNHVVIFRLTIIGSTAREDLKICVAKGVGIIYEDETNNIYPSSSFFFKELTSYSIK